MSDENRRNREGYDALFLVIPHMRFPILIRGSLIGEPDASNALTIQNGEIGPLGDLTQLVVMIEDRSGDHGCEGRIRILCPNLLLLIRPACISSYIPGMELKAAISLALKSCIE